MSPSNTSYIGLDQFRQQLKQLGRGIVSTSGAVVKKSECSVADLAWNHMDQMHRPLIHRTYTQALRPVKNPSFSISVNRWEILKLPGFILVSDIQIAPHLYLQFYTLFGFIFVYTSIELGEETYKIEWEVVSHWLFKWLHPTISRKLKRLNDVQIEEDLEIRNRRNSLRKMGFSFVTDKPDFENSNSLKMNIFAPTHSAGAQFDLKGLEPSKVQRLTKGAIEILIKPHAQGYQVWPGMCPHEGAELNAENICNQRVKCNWHGLNFDSIFISAENSHVKLFNLELTLSGHSLIVDLIGSHCLEPKIARIENVPTLG